MKRKSIILAACLLLCQALCAQPRPGSFVQTWEKGPEWLGNTVIYQIYPSSFKDSDADGIGDIPGVISELDYLESLGVGAIWFNPLFASSWKDGGYDVVDFYRVDPRFGSNEDLALLVEEAHKRGIRVLLDLVAGHTSDQHPWFTESGRDSCSRYADYYIWSNSLPDSQAERDYEKMMENPSRNTHGNWMKSPFPRARYFYKNFLSFQPALNYGFAHPDPSHPWEQSTDAPGPQAVKQEMKNIISFWYNMGVDGFRVDMAASLIKNDPDKEAVMAFWRDIRKWSDENWPNHILMAEWGEPKYCLAAGFHIDMYLNHAGTKARRMYFDKKYMANGGAYFSLNGGKAARRDLYGNRYSKDQIDRTGPAQSCKEWLDDYMDCLEWTKDWGYYSMITTNHDNLRFNTGMRNSPDQLKLMLAWILTMQLPVLYYGDEIGLRSLAGLPSVEGSTYIDASGPIERGATRTPMQWNSGPNAGFSNAEEGKIYLPVCPDWTRANSYPEYLKGNAGTTAKGAITVESQENDPESLLNWTRRLIRLRKENRAFWADAEFMPVWKESHPYPLTYLRSNGEECFFVALNPTRRCRRVSLELPDGIAPQEVISPTMLSGKASVKASGQKLTVSMGPVSVWIGRIAE